MDTQDLSLDMETEIEYDLSDFFTEILPELDIFGSANGGRCPGGCY